MNKATAKALIVRTAKANGVNRVKGAPEDIYASAGQLRGQITTLAKRGKKKLVPASDVYQRGEIYALGKAARSLLDQAQNLPETQFQDAGKVQKNLYGVWNTLRYTVELMSNPKKDADDIAFEIERSLVGLENAMGKLKNM